MSRCFRRRALSSPEALYLLLASWPYTCDASGRLKVWLFGWLALSWPGTMMLAFVARRNFRGSICIELALNTFGFAWLMFGSVECWEAEDCVDQAPLLFWFAFVTTILVWATLILTMFCLIVTTVLFVLLK
ncbi:unnamed protein product [Symbiodinium natans]|uniref:Uncharacterized protein n=1 Tax=Symbiodinium natans TaxID=878477 RepID=A0A812SK25_9DINO|nr:unnamed protein product [Symbiodinium natans]